MSGSTIRRNVNRGKTCARGEEREGGRCGGNEDEGKSLNTRNNNAIKRGWNGNWRIRIQALEIQDSSKRGFRASEQTCAGDKRVLQWNSGCFSLPFSSVYARTHTYALITVMELRIELSPVRLNIFVRA